MAARITALLKYDTVRKRESLSLSGKKNGGGSDGTQLGP
jgi:hypothetical protein